ncbi:hypothetical protein B0H65DRAFT_423417, partial [Neurospora tetraspora]
YKETIGLFNEGRCFLCKEKGYIECDCFKKERFDCKRRDYIAAIVDYYLI